MITVQRYKSVFQKASGSREVVEDDEGDLVLFEDFESLTERNRVLSEACDNELAAHLRCRAQLAEAREELGEQEVNDD